MSSELNGVITDQASRNSRKCRRVIYKTTDTDDLLRAMSEINQNEGYFRFSNNVPIVCQWGLDRPWGLLIRVEGYGYRLYSYETKKAALGELAAAKTIPRYSECQLMRLDAKAIRWNEAK
jgi:hypothetical protein